MNWLGGVDFVAGSVRSSLKMAQPYVHSRFGKSFKRLIYMGLWTPDILTEESHKKVFYVYALLWHIALLSCVVVQGIDLYMVFGNFKKMTFNLCSSTMVMLVIVKMILLTTKRERLNNLFDSLWNDFTKCTDEEDVAFLDVAYNKLNNIRNILYGGITSVICVMGFSSYFSYKWGPRILPFAAYTPALDMSKDAGYVPGLLYECILGFYVAMGILESDAMLLSVVSQVRAHCQILNKNLRKIAEFREGDEWEINKYLRTDNMLKELRELVKRHLEILKYCEELRSIINDYMAAEFLAGSIILLTNSVETTRQMSNINLPLCYQLMYVTTVMFDLFMITHYFTALTEECSNVAVAAYSASWYETDERVRRNLCFIMTRAQRPQKFTYGTLFSLDVNSFMHLLKNIYSWLMLFRQLDTK